VHDRQIDDETYTFGNHGALWMNAMTWWDHETQSIWTQPWGRALEGPLKGTQLKLLPFSLVPWGTWVEEHPDTVILDEPGFYSQQPPSDDFVLGVAFGEVARAYPYPDVVEAGMINDELNGVPLMLHANPDTRAVHIFARQLPDGTVLTFTENGQALVDEQTNSTWDPVRGVATDGLLSGQGLREIPYVSSYDWAWLDFYPESDFYGDENP
jgi:hypothetical protein